LLSLSFVESIAKTVWSTIQVQFSWWEKSVRTWSCIILTWSWIVIGLWNIVILLTWDWSWCWCWLIVIVYRWSSWTWCWWWWTSISSECWVVPTFIIWAIIELVGVVIRVSVLWLIWTLIVVERLDWLRDWLWRSWRGLRKVISACLESVETN
jgi:hypothetical protein